MHFHTASDVGCGRIAVSANDDVLTNITDAMEGQKFAYRQHLNEPIIRGCSAVAPDKSLQN